MRQFSSHKTDQDPASMNVASHRIPSYHLLIVIYLPGNFSFKLEKTKLFSDFNPMSSPVDEVNEMSSATSKTAVHSKSV